jgi:branched-chain amino acid transport system ATP-binding protein
MTSELTLVCEGLFKSYGGIRAVNNVSFVATAGRVLGLVGPNGAGKTTLVDLIDGEVSPDAGEARLGDKALKGAPARRAHKSGVARTFQHPRLATDLTVRENMALGAFAAHLFDGRSIVKALITGMFAGRPNCGTVKKELETVAQSLGIDRLDRRASELTLGEMRIVEVGRALLQHPRLILLDEPFAGADASGAVRLLAAIKNVAATGCIVLLIDHNVDLVAKACDELVLLNEGSVAISGPTEQCLQSDEMRAAYFGNPSTEVLEGALD